MTLLPGPDPAESLLQELHSLADQSGQVPLHGRALAQWMHRAFPFECPAPHSQKVTNPKTPDEWMGESGLEVAELEEMMAEITGVLARYTTMGKKADKDVYASDDTVSDPDSDVVRIHPPPKQTQPQQHLLSTLFHFAAMCSMMGIVAVGAKSGLLAT